MLQHSSRYFVAVHEFYFLQLFYKYYQFLGILNAKEGKRKRGRPPSKKLVEIDNDTTPDTKKNKYNKVAYEVQYQFNK
ncbi:hypothetical protein BpHYR1_008525 [Brachionus plicatilis]|uniref:Uncharacterized protein n=1 Tax=Brachionus plicatilis TaxID=10195 RepID=A0A3M7T4S1_BRAPC|nr:hypothetical protein BpHYR1_008525 [Brachionus plicatilis]